MPSTNMPQRFRSVAAAGLCVLAFSTGAPAADTVSLAGRWSVSLDPAQVGEAQQWAERPLTQAVPVRLPGSLTTNGIGDEISLNTPWMGFTGSGGFTSDPRYAPYCKPGRIKLPFWLQPDKYYKGRAWYQRAITVPAAWQGKQVSLLLERCHWGSAAWVDGRKVGTAESLGTPHRYSLGALPAGKHLLTLCIDNNYLIRVGPDASSVTDHTQTNWNGIIGRIELSAHSVPAIATQQIYPKNDGTLQVKLELRNDGGESVEAAIRTEITEKGSGKRVGSAAKTVTVPPGVTTTALGLKLDRPPRLWSEFTPNLHVATTTVAGETVSTPFGFREIRADGRTLLVNGVPTFMRGNLDCAAFPLTGHPSMDVAEWTRIFRVYKAYGLNHVRFHSWCPPEAAFTAADQEGMYLQPECGVWRGTCPFKTAKPVEPFLSEEAERICREYGNHPSFVLLAHGNEPWELDSKWLNDTWVPAMKKLDTRHLVAGGSHYPLGDNNDFHVPGCVGGFYIRYHGSLGKTPATTRNYEDQIALKTAPCIAHETGQWCVFPNLAEIKKYTGCMKANNFEIVRDFMKGAGMLDQARDFLMASGKFQTLIYKEEIEAYLRTRGIGGYQLLGLNDFPGQGTALVGVVDVFWDAKPYVSAAEYRRFSGPVVPLALMEKRTWTSDETFTAKIRIAQYSGAPLPDARPAWQIINAAGDEIASGRLAAGTIPVGNAMELGDVSFPLNTVTHADKLTLRVSLSGTEYRNEWNFWVYPAQSSGDIGGVVVCQTLDEALAKIAGGAAVLLLPKPAQVAGKTFGTFQPIFWNKAWFPGQKEHTLGLLIRNRHPALAQFPTDFHADWQWWEIMNRSKPMVLDSLPIGFRPIVQPIDDWNSCRRLGLLLEAKVGAGKLMIASCDLEGDLAKRPVARQFRGSLLAYMNSPAFQPAIALDEKQLGTLFAAGKANRLISKIEASSQNADYPAANAVDGNPETVWHSEWEGSAADYPHELRIELAKPAKLTGLNLLPRQDGNANGRVKGIEILTSTDGTTWRSVAEKSLANNQEWQAVTFPAGQARFIRLRMLAPQKSGEPFASFAEIEPVSAP